MVCHSLELWPCLVTLQAVTPPMEVVIAVVQFVARA